jgi:hypothetical protein
MVDEELEIASLDASPDDDAEGPLGGVGDSGIDVVDGGPVDPTRVPPFATIVRIINVGTTVVTLYPAPAPTCLYGYTIGSAPPVDALPETTLEFPDTICDCSTCGKGRDGGPLCDITEFIATILHGRSPRAVRSIFRGTGQSSAGSPRTPAPTLRFDAPSSLWREGRQAAIARRKAGFGTP